MSIYRGHKIAEMALYYSNIAPEPGQQFSYKQLSSKTHEKFAESEQVNALYYLLFSAQVQCCLDAIN